MPKVLEEWKVLPHGRLTQVESGILTVVGNIHMPLAELPRRMTVVRLADGRLVIYNAIALNEDEMEALESYGQVAYLIVPSDHHRLDAKIWKLRYPAITVVAPPGARAKVEQVVHVDATDVDFGDPHVQLMAVPGTAGHEGALFVRTPQGVTLVVNDIIANMHEEGGLQGWMLRAARFAGKEPHVPMIATLGLIRNEPALRQQLLAWANVDELRRIIVSHGDIIENQPAAALRTLAQSLAA